MKKILTVLSVVFLVSTQVHAQDTLGLWGWSRFDRPTLITDYGSQPIRGIRAIVTMAKIQPSDSVNYSWSTFDASLASMAAAGLYIHVQIWTGPDCPDWLKNVTGSYHTSTSAITTYPYYFHPAYTRLVFKFADSLIKHINALPIGTRQYITGLFFCHGTTGDEGPSHGTYIDYNFAGKSSIDENGTQWISLRTQFMDSVKSKLTRYASWLQPIFNPGNDGRLYAYARSRISNVQGKEGRLSHLNSFTGERTYFKRDSGYESRSGNTNYYITSGEGQDDPFLFSSNPHQDIFAQFVSARAGGLNIYNVDLQFMTSNMWDVGETATSTYYGTWFNNYAGAYNESKKGFSYPHYIPNFSDVVRYPVATYFDLIDPARLKTYNSAIANIDAANDSVEYKNWQKIQKMDAYLNPAREAKILQGYPGFQTSSTSLHYNDAATDQVPNWELNLTMIDTAKIGVRKQPDTSYHGRFYYTMPSGALKIRYKIADRFKKTAKTDSVRIKVTYFDTSNYVWKIGCANCKKTTVLTITNTNTGQWKTATVDVANFPYNYNYDFYIKSSSPIIWEIVEIENLSK